MTGAPSWTLGEIAGLAGGKLSPESASDLRVDWNQISLDSRTIKPGDLFVALRGESHDGHDFIESAAEAGAAAALVSRPLHLPGWPQIAVEDTLSAWQQWAAAHRAACESVHCLSLTGSSGKTTTKDLLAHLLAPLGPVWATRGNRNNHVGVPWMLLGLTAEHRHAVIEMGMNHPGEISLLSRLAAPRVAVITDIGTAHVGYLGSREAILRAKLEILDGLRGDAPVVLPQDPWVLERAAGYLGGRRVITFGLQAPADWHPEGPVEWSLSGTGFRTRQAGRLHVPLLGMGGLLSSLAALATVDALGADVARLADRLASAPRRALRMEPRRLGNTDWVMDCYNASPESTRLSIAFLREVPHPGRRILVLGALGELGGHSQSIHEDLGRRARAIDTVLFVGEETQAAWKANREAAISSGSAAWVPDAGAAAAWLRPRLRDGDLILLKGARRMALERIPDLLHPAPAEPR